MSTGHNRGGPTLGLEKFMTRDGEYPMWKDKSLAYIKELDSAYERGLLEKEQGPATVRMVDFLDSHPKEPVISISKETSK
ncbi:hypothetical protein PF010_g30890, partial [Phytophthora fragariae]